MVVQQQKPFYHTGSRFRPASPEKGIADEQPVLPTRRSHLYDSKSSNNNNGIPLLEKSYSIDIGASSAIDRPSSSSPTPQMAASRTAALNRYLAALDQPEGRNPNTEGGEGGGGGEEHHQSQQQQQQQLVDASFSSSSVAYDGHKVVAMPSLGGKSVREVANATESKPHHQRSRSAGRTPTRSRDIVQDVYDRMGVSREDLTGARDSDKFQERYRTAAALSTTIIPSVNSSPSREPSRGRSRAAEGSGMTAASPGREQGRGRGKALDNETDGQRRARSLSRGRTVSGRWPPTREQATRDAASTRSVAPGDVAVESRTQEAPPPSSSSSRMNNSYPSPALATPVTNAAASPSRPPANISYGTNPTATRTPSTQQQSRAGRGHNYQPSSSRHAEDRTVRKASSYDGIPVSWKKTSTSGAFNNNNNNKTESNGSVAEESGSASVQEEPQTPSVRDRISALSGGKSNRNFKPPSTPAQYAKREHPPKIDIYQDSRKNELIVSPVSEDLSMPEPSNIPPSPAAAAAADAAVELLVRKNQFGRNRQAPKRDGWMKPPAEIATDDEGANGMVDGNSLAMSSVSHEEYKPTKSWTTTGRYNGTSNGNHQNSYKFVSLTGDNSKQQTVTIDNLESIVEERIQRRMSEMETRMEAQMLRLESRMEERMKARMDLLEAKMDKIGSMLSMIVTTTAASPLPR